MADNFGLKIGIEGEKAFKDALRDINQSFKVLGSEMQLVTSAFDKNDNSIAALAARNEVLGKSIDTQKDKISTLQSALQNASDSFGESDRRTQNWQIQLNKAQAELNGMERELGENNSALDKFADGTDESADATDDLAGNVEDVGKEMDGAGKKTSIFGDMLKSNLLSSAITAGIQAIGSAIASIGRGLVDAAKEGIQYNAQMESYTSSFTTMLGDQAKAQELVNNLKKEAAATPFGMQDLASATQTLMGFGVSVDDAQKYMHQLGDISLGNADRFQSLSLAFAQMSATGKLTGQDLNQMINAGFNPLEEISRTTGQSIAELKEQMSQGGISAEMMAQALASATSEGGRFYGAMEAQSKTFDGQLATLQDNVAALKGQLTEGLTSMLSGTVMPMVNGWVGTLSTAFETDGVAGLTSAFGMILQEAIVFLSAQLPMFANVASQIIFSLIEGLNAALPSITTGALQLILALVTGLVANLPAIAEAAVTMVSTIHKGIGAALPELIPAAVQAVLTIVQGLISNIPMLIDGALQLIMGLAEGLIAAIPVIIEALPQIIDAILTSLLEAIPLLIDAGIQLLTSLVTNLPLIIESIIAALPLIINSIISTLILLTPLIIESGVKLLVALVQNLPQIILAIVEAVPQIIAAIVKAIIDKVGDLAKAGEQLIMGLWQGISNVKNWIMDKIRGFMDDITSGIKRFFGIRSPSTLYAGIGRNLGLGIGVGFEDAMKQVGRDMQDAIPTGFDINAGVNGNYAGGFGSTSGGGNITQNISITSPKALSEKEAAREFRNLSRKLALGVV